MNKIKFTSTILALIVCSFSHASQIPVLSNDNCSMDSVQITSITDIAPGGVNVVASPISSTSCLGFVTTPDNDWGNNPNPNMGGLYDGLLNGQIVEGQGQDKDNSYYVPGDYFLTNDKDSMVDLDGNGEATDPGWIRLGGSETKTNGEWDFDFDSIGGNDLGSVLKIKFSDDGTWSLEMDPLAIDFGTNALGRPVIFDHLAFVLKGPNNTDESWAIFDFNFHDLVDDGLDISFGDTLYKIEGEWDTDLFVNDDALSHFSIWAHDPPLTRDVPAPSTFALLILGMLGLASRRFKK
ncbi:PEP-CTERM sorting domain-containing protein [Paraglaciecola sp.]|uniref:PEP-CTERM sorting domain-containing protein n=1 Tax=Paraglaciecola sp. TaxID=1920173 RepID=UPI003EF27D0A